MYFPFYIAKRYAVSFSKNSAINVITFIASFGIIAGTIAMFVVLSVFSGLRSLSMEYTNANDPDFKVIPKNGKYITLTDKALEQLNKSKNISFYSKVVEDRVLFVFNNKDVTAYLKGVDSNFTKISNIKSYLYAGNWLEKNTNEVVVGAEISRKLGLGLFDFNSILEVYSGKAGTNAITTETDAFTVIPLYPSGIYRISEDIDSKYVFADITLVQNLLQFRNNQVSFIEIKAQNTTTDDEVRKELTAIFNNSVIVKNRIQLNDALYKMLNTENIVIYLLFVLIMIITLFNLVGALIMIILDKKHNLKTLLNLGCRVHHLQKIFLLHGLLLTLLGSFIGLLLGTVIVILQQQFNIVMINEVIAYPVVFEIKNILLVITTIIVLGYLASWIASKTITKKFLIS